MRSMIAVAAVLVAAANLPGQSAPSSLNAPETFPVHTFPASAPASRPATASVPATMPWAADAAHRPTETICRQALDWFDRAEGLVDAMMPAAEVTAAKMAAGGRLYFAGNRGFADEFDFRAGGFTFNLVYDLDKPVADGDAILIGQFRPNEPEWRLSRVLSRVQFRGNFDKGQVVYFTSLAWPQTRRMLAGVDRAFWASRLEVFDTGAPAGAGMAPQSLGQLGAAALAWAYCGEVIAAATRQGKTLATWGSDAEPGGHDWDESVRGHNLHPKYKVPPIPAGRLGREYLRQCRLQVEQFARTQPPQVRLAASRMARTVRAGGTLWVVTNAHVHPSGGAIPPELPVLNFGREFMFRQYLRNMPAGDMLVYLAYLGYPRQDADTALARSCQAVTASVQPGPTNDRLTHIQTSWKPYDTVLELPEYPIRVLPTSGVVTTPLWYALWAETLEALAENKTEPGKNPDPGGSGGTR